MGMVCDVAYKRHPVVLSESAVNLVGYVVAPMVAFVSMVVLLCVVRCMKRTPILKYAFGFRLK